MQYELLEQQSGFAVTNGTFCIEECVENSSKDDEAVKILMAINIVYQETNADQKMEEGEGILQTTYPIGNNIPAACIYRRRRL